MKIPGLRSPREKVGGFLHFGRMLDKIRLQAAGALPPGYNLGEGDGTCWDGRLCRFLRVDFEEVRRQTLAGGSDDEILRWCLEHGRAVTDEEIMIFNAFLSKRGWRDEGTPSVEKLKQEIGLGHREDILTMFDAIDADEGRL
jgi:gluconokinase